MVDDSVDEVLFIPTREVVADSLGAVRYERYERNEANREPIVKPKRKRARSKRFFDDDALDLYGGHEGFLVRTAVIRARDYDERKAPKITSPDDCWPILQHLHGGRAARATS